MVGRCAACVETRFLQEVIGGRYESGRWVYCCQSKLLVAKSLGLCSGFTSNISTEYTTIGLTPEWLLSPSGIIVCKYEPMATAANDVAGSLQVRSS